jgi:hypothetical protein
MITIRGSDVEGLLILVGFLLVGAVVGYSAFLIFRISVHQNKFEWSGALAVITALAGGGFLSYWSTPRNFAAYGIGFFAGFVFYRRALQRLGPTTGSQATPADTGNPARSEAVLGEDSSDSLKPRSQAAYVSLGSQAADAPTTISPEELIKVLSDATAPTEKRVRALFALLSYKDFEDIAITSSLRGDLHLSEYDLLLGLCILRLSFLDPDLFGNLSKVKSVKDVVDFVDSKRS